MAKPLKLLLNIGTKDARLLGLDFAKAKEGAVISVDDEHVNEMLTRGWAVEPGTEAKAGPARVAAPEHVDTTESRVGPPAGATTPTTAGPDLDAMTKEELKDHADAHKIQGVGMAMHRDEMLKVIKRAQGK